MSDHDALFKILLVGDMGVGKSCILLRYSENQFNASHVSTIGVDFKIRSIEKNGKKVKLQIWDTAGQERFRTITTSYYKGAHGVFLVYDITSDKTFEALGKWLQDIKQFTDPHISIVLVGNKLDLEDQRQVPTSVAKEFAVEHQLPFLETSALSAQNVEQAFEKMVDEIFQRSFENILPTQQPTDSKVEIGKDNNAVVKKPKKKCNI
ncbi:hypothetical protein ABK040_004542 [Willaertia magna]